MQPLNRPVNNSPRTLDSQGNPLYPGSFSFDSIKIIRKDLIEDITDLVVRLDITQDIDSPVILSSITIRDNRGFYENSKVKLLGHEMIIIKIKEIIHKNEKKNPRELTLKFTVTEYKDFVLDDNAAYIKSFIIDAVSNYAYLSKINKISRSVKGDPIEHIADIFDLNLLYDKDKYFDYDRSNNLCISHFNGVITYRTPLQAIKWLKSKAYDQDKSPFYIYSRLSDGSVVARSWNYLIDEKRNKPYKKFTQKKSNVHSLGTFEHYMEEKDKLIEINSKNKNNELEKTFSGKYTVKVKTVDYSDLIYKEESIDMTTADNLLTPEEKKRYDENIDARDKLLETIGIDDLGNFIQDRINPNEITFQKAYPLYNDAKSSRDIDYDHIASRRYYNTKINFENIDISLYGDFNLEPGMMIQLEIPNPKDNNQNLEQLSGFYIVGIITHSFVEGRYICNLNILRI